MNRKWNLKNSNLFFNFQHIILHKQKKVEKIHPPERILRHFLSPFPMPEKKHYQHKCLYRARVHQRQSTMATRRSPVYLVSMRHRPTLALKKTKYDGNFWGMLKDLTFWCNAKLLIGGVLCPIIVWGMSENCWFRFSLKRKSLGCNYKILPAILVMECDISK